MKYYRLDKDTNMVDEVTRDIVLERLSNVYFDPVLALDESSKDFPADNMFALYWKEED